MESSRTYTVGEVFRMFDLDAIGDAWVLIIEKGWKYERPNENEKWQITIPPEDMPKQKAH